MLRLLSPTSVPHVISAHVQGETADGAKLRDHEDVLATLDWFGDDPSDAVRGDSDLPMPDGPAARRLRGLVYKLDGKLVRTLMPAVITFAAA